MYHMGPLLSKISRTCLDAGATPILVAHSKKASGTKVPELEDLAFAGIQEFARQWLLVGRRKAYEEGTGSHRLWFNTGGSAGFSGRWAIDIEEGTVDSRFASRHWDVAVRSGSEEKERQDEVTGLQEVEQRKDRFRECRERVKKALRERPDGETRTGLREATGTNGKLLKRVLDAMLKKGTLVETTVEKRAGNAGSRKHDGFRLARRSKKKLRCDSN